jgi:hypothetical protein
MDGELPDIRETYESLAGVWANHFDVFWSPHEFTIDFTRLELREDKPPERGIAVARVAMSPALMLQLRQALDSE